VVSEYTLNKNMNTYTEQTLEESDVKLLKVFLAFTPEDRDRAFRLQEKLKLESWLEPTTEEDEVLPGENRDREIKRAIGESDVVLLCFSPGAADRPGDLQRDIRVALEVAQEQPSDTIYIVPVCFEQCEIPELLEDYHPVVMTVENSYTRLLRALRQKAELLDVTISELSELSADLDLPDAPDFATPPLSPEIERLIERMENSYLNDEWREVVEAGENLLALKFRQYDVIRKLAEGYVELTTEAFFQTERDVPLALRYATRALELKPDSPSLYFNRAMVYYLSQNYGEAENDFKQAIRLRTNYGDAYFYLSQIYGIHGEKEHARAYLRKAVLHNSECAVAELDKTDPKVSAADQEQIEMLNAELDKLSLRDATGQIIEIGEQILKLNKLHGSAAKIAKAYLARGRKLYRQKDYQAALQDFDRALQLDLNLAQAQGYRGLARYLSGDSHKALDDLNRAIELDPDFGRAYCWRGQIYLALNRTEEARHDFERAQELGVADAREQLLELGTGDRG
jgi:tetratricopeptide (TPR) repeat protein